MIIGSRKVWHAGCNEVLRRNEIKFQNLLETTTMAITKKSLISTTASSTKDRMNSGSRVAATKLTAAKASLSSPKAHGGGLISPTSSSLSSPKAHGLSSPKAAGLSSPKAHGLSSPKAAGLSSPKAAGLSSPKAAGLSSPKVMIN
jgi:hypothetical protein